VVFTDPALAASADRKTSRGHTERISEMTEIAQIGRTLEPPDVHDIEIRVTVTCPCTPGKPLIIRGLAAAVACEGCQRKFALGMLQFDRNGEQPGLTYAVGVAMPSIVRAV
jgi:hypothetical protein